MSPALNNATCSEGSLCMNGSLRQPSLNQTSSEYEFNNTVTTTSVFPLNGIALLPYDFKTTFKWVFPLHVYVFAFLFFLLAFYTFFSILNLSSQLSTRPFMSTINVFVCILGVSRAVSFIIDPYFTYKRFPKLIVYILWDAGYPAILSAFSLIQLAFSQLTQMKFRPESLRKKSSMSLIITAHFVFVLGSNVMAAIQQHLEMIRDVVQSLFICWGLVLCVTFLYGGARIIRLLKELPNSAFQNGETVGEHKGILQLALLAQCNNIASSVITAAAPSTLAPKIKITDENDLTFSIASEASKLSSPINTAGNSGNSTNVPQINITTVESPLSSSEPSPNNPTIYTFDPISEVKEEYSDEKCQEEKSNNSESKSKVDDSVQISIEINQENNKTVPGRKKSLTWSDDPSEDKNEVQASGCQSYQGATLGSNISSGKRHRKGSDSSSNRRSSGTSKLYNRKNSGSSDISMRKGSHSSIASSRQGSLSSEVSLRKDSINSEIGTRKGSHIGEALVGNRRSSYKSDLPGRRGSHGLNTGASSSRRGSNKHQSEDREGENLLQCKSGHEADMTLTSVLNHIAYANQSGGSKVPTKAKGSRKEQIIQVLNITYVCAIFGMILSILLAFDPYIRTFPNSHVQSWLWFSYVSLCRLLELLVGCAMANITRQPANRHIQYGYSLRMKPRNSIYM